MCKRVWAGACLLAALSTSPRDAHAELLTIVSNASSWRQSTEFIDANTNDQPWAGVSTLPGDATFSLIPIEGGFANHIDNVSGSTNVLAGRGVRYFRTQFLLPQFDTLTADFQISVDNDVHLFINGNALGLESGPPDDAPGQNFHGGIHHRLFIAADGQVENGYLGGDQFDLFASQFEPGLWNVGLNEIVLAIRNDSPPKQFGDLGGFSFRADIETSNVPEPSCVAMLAGLGAVGGFRWTRRRRRHIAEA